MDEREMRANCLNEAIRCHSAPHVTPEEIIRAATIYLAFVNGDPAADLVGGPSNIPQEPKWVRDYQAKLDSDEGPGGDSVPQAKN